MTAVSRSGMVDTFVRALVRWAAYHVAGAVGLGVVAVVLVLVFIHAPRRRRAPVGRRR